MRTLPILLLGLCVVASPQDLGGLANAAKGAAKKKEPPPYTGPKKRLAVMDMEVKINSAASATPSSGNGSTTIDIPSPTDFGTGLTEMLTTALVNTHRFVVLERKALQDIQNEHNLGNSGSVDPTAAAKSGRLLGAQAIMRGAVTEFSFKKSSIGGAGIIGKIGDLSHGEGEAYVALDIRFYSTETGEVLDSVKAEGRAKSHGTQFDLTEGDIKIGGDSFDNSPLGEATRHAIEDAVKKIVLRMEKVPWEARVAEIEKDGDHLGSVYVNAGSAMGIKAGDEFEFYKPGRDIVDPQTKVAIGRTKDHRFGHGKVESVTDNLAVVTISEGTDYAVGDVVRLVGTTKS